MQRLKSREKQIPYGMKFRQAEIDWDSTKVLGIGPSFTSLVTAVMSVRKAHPHHAQQHKWALDRAGVEADVEAFQVQLCLAHGWTNYLTAGGGGGVPFPSAQSLPDPKQLNVAVDAVRKLWSGIKSLNEFLDGNVPPVESALAEKRAAVCAVCPMNGKGDFSAWFSKPAADVVRKQVERFQERKIATSQDDKIDVCESCLCPLRLMVHVPLQIKLAHMDQNTKNDLHPACWILAEEKALQS